MTTLALISCGLRRFHSLDSDQCIHFIVGKSSVIRVLPAVGNPKNMPRLHLKSQIVTGNSQKYPGNIVEKHGILSVWKSGNPKYRSCAPSWYIAMEVTVISSP